MPRKNKQWADYWQKRNTKKHNVTITGCCYIERSGTGTRVQVTIPVENEDAFILPAVKMGARRRPRSNMWSFKGDRWPDVLRLCHGLYGENKTVIKGESNQPEPEPLQPYYTVDERTPIDTPQDGKEAENEA